MILNRLLTYNISMKLGCFKHQESDESCGNVEREWYHIIQAQLMKIVYHHDNYWNQSNVIVHPSPTTKREIDLRKFSSKNENKIHRFRHAFTWKDSKYASLRPFLRQCQIQTGNFSLDFLSRLYISPSGPVACITCGPLKFSGFAIHHNKIVANFYDALFQSLVLLCTLSCLILGVS